MPAPVQQLLERSHRLGADRRNTNYAGGNTSAKGLADDPASGSPAPVMWVKGSGGDLATLQASGLSVVRTDRLRALTGAYLGPQAEDDMVELMKLCLHGDGGSAPSIDTAMHGLLEFDHVDHLHPDSCLALAAASDGEELTRRCFGDRVIWVPWRRPGFQLGLDIRDIARQNPQAVGCVLGGHGITAWGSTSDECEERSLWMVRTATDFLAREGRPDPLGPVLDERAALPAESRRRRAIEIFPLLRRLASTDTAVVGAFDDSPEVLDFLSRAAMPDVAGRGTSCPDHFIRTKVRPLIIDAAADAPLQQLVSRITDLHQAYRADYRRYYLDNAEPSSPAMRGADPAVVLVPGVGMFTFGRDAGTARLAGEFFVNAIHAMIGAESVSRYQPIEEREKFRIEYWPLEEAKLRRLPPRKPLSGSVVLLIVDESERASRPLSSAADACENALAAQGAQVLWPDKRAPVQVGGTTVGDAGAEVASVMADAALVHGGLDAVVVFAEAMPPEAAEHLRRVTGSPDGTACLVHVDPEPGPSLAPSAATVPAGVRSHHITVGGAADPAVASSVVSALTSGAWRSELTLTAG
jgi:rhamnulose-1-phosphate aldolase/alcohol dehydrogenase